MINEANEQANHLTLIERPNSQQLALANASSTFKAGIKEGGRDGPPATRTDETQKQRTPPLYAEFA